MFLPGLSVIGTSIQGPGESRTAEPFIALNEIFVVFADFPPVISAIKKMYDEFNQPGRLEDNFLTLIKAMAAASDVPIINLNDEFIMRPFIPIGFREQP